MSEVLSYVVTRDAPWTEPVAVAAGLGGGDGVLALLSDGGASRRLGLAPLLDAVDGDGRGLVVSGRAEPGVEVTVMAGGMAVHAVAGDDRRWTASLSGVGESIFECSAAGRCRCWCICG